MSHKFSVSPALQKAYRCFIWLSLSLSSSFSVAGQVPLSWDTSPSSNLGGYRIYYGQSSRNYKANIDVGNKTTHTLQGLTDGKKYYFAVKAYNTNRSAESGFSNEVSLLLPNRPSDPAATDYTYANKVVITWGGISGATQYRVYRCTRTAVSSCGTAIGFPQGTSYTDTKGKPGRTYYYRVKACKGQSCSYYSPYNAGARTNNGAVGESPGTLRAGRYWYLDTGDDVWSGCAVDRCPQFGKSGDLAIVGDWNGDGKTEIGVKRGAKWYLDYNGNGTWNNGDRVYTFGLASDQPVAGDWNGDGKTEIGVKRGARWYLDYNGNGDWNNGDRAYKFGLASDQPVVGDWDGSSRDNIGVFRKGKWYMDHGNGVWNGCVLDQCLDSFGAVGDLPVAGRFYGSVIASNMLQHDADAARREFTARYLDPTPKSLPQIDAAQRVQHANLSPLLRDLLARQESTVNDFWASSDGTRIVFASDASDLVAGDTNDVFDVFLYDTVADRIQRISVDSLGQQANGSSYSPRMDGLGNKIAFVSEADNLTADDANQVADVFLHDLNNASTVRVSYEEWETEAQSTAQHPAIDGAGDFVFYDRVNITGRRQIYGYEHASSTTEQISLAPEDEDGIWFDNEHPGVSVDGQFVVYLERTAASFDIATPNVCQVHILDRLTGDFVRILCPEALTALVNPEPAFTEDERLIYWNDYLNQEPSYVGETQREDIVMVNPLVNEP